METIDELKEIDELIKEIISKSEETQYIYRGENKDYGKVSSTLYRECKDIITKDFLITNIENKFILKKEKVHFPTNTSNFDVLSEMQHYGGKTSLIDFSRNIYIALFFACDGNFKKDGRLIFLKEADLQEQEDIYKDKKNPNKNILLVSRSKNNRVIFQSSVFVHPPEGYLNINEKDFISIDHDLKNGILYYLGKHFNIHLDTIYNDLQGLINNTNIDKIAMDLCYKAFSCAKSRNYEDAIKLNNEAIKLNPNYGLAYNNRGNAKSHLGKYEGAIEDYDQVIKLNPNYAEPYNNRGVAKSYLKNYEGAIEDYDKAIKLNRNYVNAYNNRGNAKSHLGKYEGAIEDYKKAIELNPNYELAKENLKIAEALLKKQNDDKTK